MNIERTHIRGLGPFDDVVIDLLAIPGPVIAVVGPNGSAYCVDARCVAYWRRTHERVEVPTTKLAERLDAEVRKWTSLLSAVRARYYPRLLYLSYDDLQDDTCRSSYER